MFKLLLIVNGLLAISISANAFGANIDKALMVGLAVAQALAAILLVICYFFMKNE